GSAIMTSVLGIDQGTTATKALVLNESGVIRQLGALQHQQYYPQPGWVEHDGEELLTNIRATIDTAGIEIDAVGIANQGETVLAWDATTGRAIHHAIVWQDTRSAPMIDRLRADGAESLTLARSGLPLNAYFSASKMRWLLDHVSEA